jgi:exonuclease-1
MSNIFIYLSQKLEMHKFAALHVKALDPPSDICIFCLQACRARGVDCIVAPYEADAQLAYLNKRGIAQVIITEDSDLLLFGCEKVLTNTKTGKIKVIYSRCKYYK